MSQTIAGFLPIIVATVFFVISKASISDWGRKKKEEETEKEKYLQRVYKYANWAIAFAMLVPDLMISYSNYDITKLFANRRTYDVVYLLSRTGIEEGNYNMLLITLLCISMVCPILYLSSEIIERKRRSASDSKSLSNMIFDFANRVIMFSVGALVSWFSLIVLLKTPVDLLRETPYIKSVEYLFLQLCLFLNFRFQMKADGKYEDKPSRYGCFVMSCSAVWCTFVYTVFAISLFFTISTVIHVNSYVIKNGVYRFIYTDCRIYLILVSIAYAILFYVTGRGKFRKTHSFVYAFYVIPAIFLILFLLLFATNESTLMSYFICAFIFLLVYVYLLMKRGTIRADDATEKSKHEFDESVDKSTHMVAEKDENGGNGGEAIISRNTPSRKGSKFDYWLYITIITSIVLLLLGFFPLVEA